MKNLLTKLLKKKQSDSAIPMPAAGGVPISIKKKRHTPIGFIVAVFLIVGTVMVGQYVVSQKKSNNSSSVKGVTSPMGRQLFEINKSFQFPAYTADRKLASKKVDFTVTTVEKTNEIIIKGKRATAVAGRAFLIVNLKISSDASDSLFLNSRNFIRIKSKDSDDMLAPDIHNDTVEVQPQSTKITRVGVPIDAGTNEFTVYIGELDKVKDRTEIPVHF